MKPFMSNRPGMPIIYTMSFQLFKPYKKISIIHPYTMYPIDLLILFYSEKLVRKSKIEVVLKFLILIVISFLFK